VTFFDTDVPPGTVLARASAGEVLPGYTPVLVWQLVGEAFDTANHDALVRWFGALDAREAEDICFVHRVNGYLYLNVTALRFVADRFPGADGWQRVDEHAGLQPGSVPHTPGRRSTARELVVSARLGISMAALPVRRAFDRYVLSRRLSRPLPADALELLGEVRAVRALIARLLSTHHAARFFATGAVESLMTLVERAGGDSELALRLGRNIPTLRSAEPGRALHELVQGLSDGDRTILSKAASMRELEDRAPRVADALRDFASRFAHRGLAEFDPLVPTWGIDHEGVLALARSLASAPLQAAVEPVKLTRGLKAPWRPAARISAFGARRMVAQSEMTKDATLLAVHRLRGVLAALSAAVDGVVPPELLPHMTIEELEAAVRTGGADTGALERRAVELEASAAPPSVLVDGSEVPSTVEGLADTTVITGVAASPGAVSGIARVMLSPDEEIGPGEILVAPTTDTAWTPLFFVAAGVVTDAGGLLSHASIVAREVGIPAVAGTATSTSTISSGDLVTVDGTAGRVTIDKSSEAPLDTADSSS
jgi:rifampicin phosphotransferase